MFPLNIYVSIDGRLTAKSFSISSDNNIHIYVAGYHGTDKQMILIDGMFSLGVCRL